MVLATSAHRHHFVCTSVLHWIQICLCLCCHLFAGLVDILLQAAYRLTWGMQCRRNIRLGMPQTEMYIVKKPLKNDAFIHVPSKSLGGVIIFKIYKVNHSCQMSWYHNPFMGSQVGQGMAIGLPIGNPIASKDSRITSGLFWVQSAWILSTASLCLVANLAHCCTCMSYRRCIGCRIQVKI